MLTLPKMKRQRLERLPYVRHPPDQKNVALLAIEDARNPSDNRNVALSATEDAKENVSARKRLKFDKGDSISLRVLLPNGTSLKMQINRGEWNVESLVEQLEHKAAVAVNIRQINWRGTVWLEDRFGNHVDDLEQFFMQRKPQQIVIVQDGHPDTIHKDQELWNVTPEPEMLDRLPDGYSLETALADHVDNALQAVWENGENCRRLVSVEISRDKISIFDTGLGMDASEENSIAKWGTVGASTHRNLQHLGIGGDPPFLKPYLGRYGVGGVAAALHLGKNVVVRSKTKTSNKVVSLILRKGEIVKNQQKSEGGKVSRIWRTNGGFHDMTEEESKKSPHASFTCVEISNLNPQACVEGERQYWRIKQVKQMLKDIYSLYIQADLGNSNRTSTSVEFEVNGENLLEEVGGEITLCNVHSCNGDPFVVDLHFSKTATGSERHDVHNALNKAHARLTCQYFPSIKGKETLEGVIQELQGHKLYSSTSPFKETFETFPRIGIRWLGRLLPMARWHSMPFMEMPAREEKKGTHRWLKRVKIFADVDGGFQPTPVKTALDEMHPFTIALKQLGGTGGLNTNVADVGTRIYHKNKEISSQQLGNEFKQWVKAMHERFDEETEFGDDPIFVISQGDLKKSLGVERAVIMFHKHLKDPKGDWKAGQRIKLQTGISGTNRNFYGIIEWFFYDAADEEHGEVRGEVKMVCRPLEVAEAAGSKMETRKGACYFEMNKCKCFPVAYLNSEKCQELTEEEWNKQLVKFRNRSPLHLEILNEEEREFFGEQALPKSGSTFQAGYALPRQVLLVVRPLRGTGLSYKHGMIVAENLKMKLEVVFKGASSETQSLGCYFCVGGTRKSVNGIYCFTIKDVCQQLEKSGSYEFRFSLVDEGYAHVKPTSWILNIEPLGRIKRWAVSGDNERFTIMLDEIVELPLFLNKYDKYDNPICFEELLNVKVAIVANGETLDAALLKNEDNVSLSEDKRRMVIKNFVIRCSLDSIYPTYEASLCVYVGNEAVADMKCLVYPGNLASLEIMECSLAVTSFPYYIEEPLKPGDCIQHLSFQGKDQFGNVVRKGSKVILEVTGIQLEDTTREVDDTGHIYLNKLRVTSLYNSTGSIVVCSQQRVRLIEILFKLVTRRLRFATEPPRRALVGRIVDGLVVEIVDKNGTVDTSVGGPHHTLSVDWVDNIRCDFYEGKCSLPKMVLPQSPGTWKGRISHSFSSNVHLDFEIEAEMANASRITQEGEFQVVVGRCGKQLSLPFRAVDELDLPAILDKASMDEMDIQVVPDDGTFPMEDTIEDKMVVKLDGKYFLKIVMHGKEGSYKLSIILGGTTLSWKLRLRPGPMSELIPVFSSGGDRLNELWKALRTPVRVVPVCRRSMFPDLYVYAVDRAGNICDIYEGAEVVMEILGSDTFKQVQHIKDGYGHFPSFLLDAQVGHHKMVVRMDMEELDMEVDVTPGNYPSALKLLDDLPVTVTLSDETVQYIPAISIGVESADGLALDHVQKPSLRILKISREAYDAKCYSSEGSPMQSIFIFQDVRVPLECGDYLLEFFIVENDEINSPLLPLHVIHGQPARLEFDQVNFDGKMKNVVVNVVDVHGNYCKSMPDIELGAELTRENTTGSLAYAAIAKHGQASFDISKIGPGSYTYRVFVHDSTSGLNLTPTTTQLLAIRGQQAQECDRLTRELENSSKSLCEIREAISNLYAKVQDQQARMYRAQQALEASQEALKELKAQENELVNLQIARNDEAVLRNERLQPSRSEKEVVNEFNLLARKGNGGPLAFWKARTDSTLSDLIGQVVMLARVESEALNRMVSEYLDREICTIVCKSQQGIDFLETYDTNGNIDETEGLHGYARLQKLPICGRFRAIALRDIKPYKCRNGEEAVDAQHPQKLLRIPAPVLPSGCCPSGFLGYAVNLLHLSQEQLQPTRLHGGHSTTLRESLFFHLFQRLQVYDTRKNLLTAKQSMKTWTGAISLDGAIIRSDFQQDLGKSRPPAVTFPLVPYEERVSCALLPPAAAAFGRQRARKELSLAYDRHKESIAYNQELLNSTKNELFRWDKLAFSLVETERAGRLKRMELANHLARIQNILSHAHCETDDENTSIQVFMVRCES